MDCIGILAEASFALKPRLERELTVSDAVIPFVWRIPCSPDSLITKCPLSNLSQDVLQWPMCSQNRSLSEISNLW